MPDTKTNVNSTNTQDTPTRQGDAWEAPDEAAQRAWEQDVGDYLSGKDNWLHRHLHGEE